MEPGKADSSMHHENEEAEKDKSRSQTSGAAKAPIEKITAEALDRIQDATIAYFHHWLNDPDRYEEQLAGLKPFDTAGRQTRMPYVMEHATGATGAANKSKASTIRRQMTQTDLVKADAADG